jgi:hydroxypyruvate isomerase
MPKFSANLSMLFKEVDFLDRFGLASRAGFKAVEFMFPYEWDKDELKRRLTEHNLEQVLHNLPAGNWSVGERGLACLPDRVSEFQDGVKLAIEYATALGCPRFNCLAGIPPSTLSFEERQSTLVANVRYAAEEAQKAGIRLLVEALNSHDMPGSASATRSKCWTSSSGRPSQSVHPVRHLPHADHGGKPDQDHRSESGTYRTHTACRCPGTA